MLDIMNTVTKKLFIRIDRCKDIPSNGTVANIVKEIILDQLHTRFNLSSDWDNFLTGSSMCNETNETNTSTASLNSDPYKPLWAMTLREKDINNVRRRWSYHIGIRESDQNSIQLCYARCRYDHLAGSIHSVHPTALTQDSFLLPIFQDQRIQCMCGVSPYPAQPLELSEASLSNFIALLQDELRTQFLSL